MAEVEFSLLGPLMVRREGMSVDIAAGRQRVLLATLLVNAGRVVPTGELIEVLWDASPPVSALVSLRNYVKRLRKVLADTAHRRISTYAGGYLIRVDAGELDVTQFEALLGAAQTASQRGSWETAAAESRAALALWRGEPLADVGSEVLSLREAPRLTEMRLQALEVRFDADLQLGCQPAMIAELRRLVGEHALRERLHAQLMLALYRDDRQAEALAAYQHARQVLREELGTEPGVRLRKLHQQILTADPALARPEPARPAAGAAVRVVPRELPPGVQHFTGRADQLTALTSLLDRSGAEMPGTVLISAIGGTAGVGKTALAVHWAHRVARRFPDGQLYANLRGYDPSGVPVAPGEIIRGFLDALAVPVERIPAGLNAQAGLYRSLLADRRVLVVLDNARDAAQVRPLLPGAAGCLVLVTSRSQLTGLAAADGASPLNVSVLTDDEARDLLTCRLGRDRVSAEPEAVTELITLSARLPLALNIAAARAAAQPRHTLAALAAGLRDERGRLDALDTGDPASSLRVMFSWSYQNLGTPAARMFRLLGLHSGPDITTAAAASLAAVVPTRARALINELADANLIAEHAPGRYTFHDLLRAYATDLAATTDTDAERHEAVARVLDHYLHTAYSGALTLNRARPRFPLAPPRSGVTPETVADLDDALAWFSAERQVLLTAITQAEVLGFYRHAWQLPWALALFFDRMGYWHDLEASEHTAIAAAQRLGDRAGQAYACRDLGWARFHLGAFTDALACFRQALEMHIQIGDRPGAARDHHDIAAAADRLGSFGEALDNAQESLALFEAEDDDAGVAKASNVVGYLHVQMGDYEQAMVYCQRALGLLSGRKDPLNEAATLDSIGYALTHLGRPAEALTFLRRAARMIKEVRAPYWQVDVLVHLGDACQAGGEPEQCRHAWQEALAIMDDLHHPDADQVRAKLAGLRMISRAQDQLTVNA